MQEIDYVEELLEQIASIENNNEKLKMYQEAIRGANIRIEKLESQIDQARIEYDKKIEELRKLLEQEENWKEQIKQAKEKVISEMESQNLQQTPNTFDENYYDAEGFDSKGYDAEGFDRKGFNKKGIHRETMSQYGPDGFDKYGYNSEGYDISGYDIRGLDKNDYDRQGYNAYGYTVDGFDKNGKYESVFDFSDKKEERVKALKAAQREKEQLTYKKENPESKREEKIRKIGCYTEYFEKLREEEQRLAEKLYGKEEKNK